MKRLAWLSLILVPAVLVLAGCRSPSAKAPSTIVAPTSAAQPAMNPKHFKQEQKGVENRIDRLEQVTIEQKELQARLNHNLQNLQRQIDAQQALLQKREAEIRDMRAALASAENPVAVPQVAPVESSSNVTQMVAEGTRLLRAGNPDEAEKMFSAALTNDPSLAAARFGLASCLYVRGDFSQAKKLADEVIKAEPRNAEALGLAGIIAWKQNDLKLATALLERAIKQNPDDAQWHNYLGIIRYAQGKRSYAVDELRKAVGLNPNLAEANFNLAVILATDDRPQLDVARQYYQASLRLGKMRDEKLEGILYQ